MKRFLLKHMSVVALLLVIGWAVLAEDCTVKVLPGESIQAAIDAAPEGATVRLAEGEWEEHITIEKSLTLCGAGAEKTMLRGVEDALPVVAIYGSDVAEIRVDLSRIHVGRIADGDGPGLVIGELFHGGAEAMIESCTVSGHSTGILLQHHSTVTMTGCTVSDNSFDGIGVGGNVHVTITDSTVSDNRYGLRFWASPQATISRSTVSGSARDSVVIGHSAQVTISQSTVTGGRSAILISGSAEATIQDNTIQDHSSYGVALIEPLCFSTDSVFTGYIVGSGNTGGENVGGMICPNALGFLFTEEGGELDQRE
jgi:nitrous oxidase accessory protein